MQIIHAEVIFTCDENFTILRDYAVAFDDKIRLIAPLKEAQKLYQAAPVTHAQILTPALINAHTHLEFSANKAEFSYGEFSSWLKSIVNSCVTVDPATRVNAAVAALKEMLKSGVGTFGEISSFGSETQICAKSGARVVFFVEILGSNPQALTQNANFFDSRLEAAFALKSPLFTPAVAIHSPYSTHPQLAAHALKAATQNNLVTSAHFLESKAELDWLQTASGALKNHLLSLNPTATPFYTPREFLALFKGRHTLLTHCVFADEFFDEFEENFFVTHCPRSNRLLGQKRLDITRLKRFALATDSLSSNYSLNLFDELRAALLTHATQPLNELAQQLFCAVTRDAAKALNLDSGVIKVGKLADFATFLNTAKNDDILLNLVLNTTQAEQVFVGGREILSQI